jgi:hypothetical protein
LRKHSVLLFWGLILAAVIYIGLRPEPTPAKIQEQRRGLAEQRIYPFKDAEGRCYMAMDNPVYYGYTITTFTLVPCKESEEKEHE